MDNNYYNYLHSITVIMMIWVCPTSLAAFSVADSVESNDSVHYASPGSKKNIIKSVINYFESSNKDSLTRSPKFSFIGGPHYSSDTKFGIGLLAAGLYSTDPGNIALKPSNVTLFADVTTGKYFKIGVEGLHLYHSDSRRIGYELFFSSYSTYYWGIGVDNGLIEKNKTKYLLLDIAFGIEHLWKVWRNIYIGTLLKLDYTMADDVHDAAMWIHQPRKTFVGVSGVKFQFDTRDNNTSPSNGWLGEMAFSYNQGLSYIYNNHFSSIDFNICNYAAVWRNGTLATRLHGIFTFGNTPWCHMPTFGESGTMRGYYEGQYRDKKEVDFTVELRQHIYRRSGVVVWGGLGALFPSFREIHGRYLLPTYGIGYRWEFKKKTNVRLDIGFGKKCWGVEFNIGEAF